MPEYQPRHADHAGRPACTCRQRGKLWHMHNIDCAVMREVTVRLHLTPDNVHYAPAEW